VVYHRYRVTRDVRTVFTDEPISASGEPIFITEPEAISSMRKMERCHLSRRHLSLSGHKWGHKTVRCFNLSRRMLEIHA